MSIQYEKKFNLGDRVKHKITKQEMYVVGFPDSDDIMYNGQSYEDIICRFYGIGREVKENNFFSKVYETNEGWHREYFNENEIELIEKATNKT